MQIETGNLDTIPRLYWASFRQAYPGDEHLYLACHAAFPIALTTDLLYKIWLNFSKTTTVEDPLELLSTVSDLLHSDLCREVGRDMYEMQPDIRELLISTLQTSEAFGEARVFEMARFLRDYLQYNPEKIPTLTFKEAQNWLVASYLEPEKAAKLILDLLQQEEENPDAGIKIDYFLSWAKERNKLNQISSNTGDALLTAEQMVLGIRQYKAGDLEGALERLKPFQKLFMEGEEKVGKGFKTKIPTEVWSALRPSDTGTKPMSLALQLIENEKIERTGELDLRNCGLTEIPTELSELHWLEKLTLSENKNLKDISILAALPNLIMLNLYDTQVNNISPLSNLVHLEDLVLARTEISDLSPLSGLMNLKILNANETQITELSPLVTLSDLTEIDISRTNVEDLMPLSELKKIKKINCSETNIHDLSFVNNLLYLQEIRVSSTLIWDLSPLQNLKKLELLYIANTYVTDIAPIVPLLKLQLIELDIDGCDLVEPPNEIANEGVGAILEYFNNKNALTGNGGDDNLKKEASYKSEKDSYSDYGMPILFFAFSNEVDRPITTLTREAKSIRDLMAPKEARLDFAVHINQFVSRIEIVEFLTLYRNSVELFYFSGYLEKENLLFDERAELYGIAEMLGECPRLKLVILNGCATVERVQGLLNAGVPSVIATHAAIGDNLATDFAIQFFKSLVDGYDLRNALEFAKNYTKSMASHTLDIQFLSGIETNGILEENEPLWGLFCRDEKVLTWVLPQAKYQFEREKNIENILLYILEALSPYSDKCSKLYGNIHLARGKFFIDRVGEVVVESFSGPIGTSIRRLIACSKDKEIDSLKILQLSLEGFEIVLKITAYMLLSELNNSFFRNRYAIPKKNDVQNFFKLNNREIKTNDLLKLIIEIYTTMEGLGFSWFIVEFESLASQFKDNKSTLRQAINYFETLDLNQFGGSQAKIEEQCLIAGKALSVTLGHLAFLSTYLMVSVKEVKVLNDRLRGEIKYEMTLVKLISNYRGGEKATFIANKPWENLSVVMIKGEDIDSGYLNISPLIIDIAAFENKDYIERLCFFENYNKANDTYTYKHDGWGDYLIISVQQNFQPIKDQFDAFSKLVFDKSMREL